MRVHEPTKSIFGSMRTQKMTRRDLVKAIGISAATIGFVGLPCGIATADSDDPDRSMSPQPQARTSLPPMPETLDLAQRGEAALHVLTGALDPEHDYEIYFNVQFCRKPAVMVHDATGLPTNEPKFAESQPMMRVMSGSQHNLDIQQNMVKAMLQNIRPDGLYYAPLKNRPWAETGGLAVAGKAKPFANVYGNSRFLLAMMAWFQWEKNSAWEERMQNLADGLVRIAIDKGDYAYYPVNRGVGEQYSYTEGGWAEREEPRDGAFGVPMYFGGPVRALSGWYQISGDRKALTMAGKLAAYLRSPFVWSAQEPGIHGWEHGHATGHFHGHSMALRGLLAYGIAIQDIDLMLFVRDGYEWLRNFGVSRIGWFPENIAANQQCESCCIADMTALAIRLSQSGIGDYWDDVDRYVRNQLAEQQLLNREYLQNLAENSPTQPIHPPTETSDHVIDRCLGGFVGHGELTLLPDTWIMQCCTGNGTQALYYAWDSILENRGDHSVVNLLLNRLSPQLDVYSYLPYEGRVVLLNKTSKQISIRIPAWVNRQHISCFIGDRRIDATWCGHYMLVEGLTGSETVTITFLMTERTVKFGHHDKQFAALLKERTSYPVAGKFSHDTEEYVAHFKGNTVIDFSPKQDGVGYPIYQRSFFRSNKAPERQRPAYVAKATLKWV